MNLTLPLDTGTHSAVTAVSAVQGVEHNSEAALWAVSQGRGRAAGRINMSAAETIAAQHCLRNPACSKALGHAGFCDNGKSASAMRHNSLAGLAAAAEQASNRSSTGGGRCTNSGFGCFKQQQSLLLVCTVLLVCTDDIL